MIFPWLDTAWKQCLAGRQRAHHALLIHGPAGIGKSAFASRLAQALLCEAPRTDGAPCDACDACRWFAERNHPDFRLLAPAAAEEARENAAEGDGDGGQGAAAPATRAGSRASREIRIDQVRALERFTEVGGHRGGAKVVLIDPADALNTAAANALLKTLEEPTRGTRFLLVTARPDALPATVRSRCSALALPLPAPEAAVQWLAADADVGATEARAWLAAAGGAPLRARRFADPAHAAVHRLVVETLAALPETGVVRAADALAGVEPPVWVAALQSWVVDLQRVCAGAEPRYFPERADRLHALSRRTGLAALERLASRLDGVARAVEHPLNPRLMLEDALLGVREAFAG